MRNCFVGFFLLCLLTTTYGQTKMDYHSVSGGTTTGPSSNATMQLSGSFGQAMVESYGGFYTAVFYSGGNAPSINNTTIAKISDNIDFPILATITDPDDQVASAKILYRPIGSKDFIEATFPGVLSAYAFNVNKGVTSKMGLEYYITAEDVSGNSTRSPATGYHHASFDFTSPSIPSELLKVGTKTADYRAIAVPFKYASPDNGIVSLLTDDFDGKNDNTLWRFFAYNNATDVNDEYPAKLTTLEPGRGYWFLSKESRILDLIPFVAPDYYASNLFQMQLKEGWNLIGNPYTVDISWSNVVNYNTGKSVNPIKMYSGSYANGDVIKAFQGGFVYADADMTIEIPFAAQTSSGGRIKQDEFSQDLSDDAWKLDLVAKQGEQKNFLGGIGMHPEAQNGKDGFDDLNPPHFAEFVELNFPHPEHRMKAFCKDIVARQDSYVWDFFADAATEEELTLSWDNSSLGNNNLDLVLLDVKNSRVIDMRAMNAYSTKGKGSFRIYYGYDAFANARPETLVVSNPYPNPLDKNTSHVSIPFSLPGNNEVYQVKADVYNVQGQLIKTLTNQSYSSGFYETTWTGEDRFGNRTNAGLYFYRFSIRQGVTEKMYSGKIQLSN